MTIISTDQMGYRLEITEIPKRIISLVPSQTELLYDLGVGDLVAGVTHFCIHPPIALKTKIRVGGTKNFKPEVIRKIKPDLIIANKEENDKALLEELMKEFPVWVSDIDNLPSALEMIKEVGKLTGTAKKAMEMAGDIQLRFDTLQPPLAKKRCLYLIWRQPWMSVGSATFIDAMMTYAGMENICSAEERYPTLSDNDIRQLNPEVVLLSSEPYPFKEKHIPEMKALLPHAQILCVDGEMFSWYGSRLLQTPIYLKGLMADLARLRRG